MGVMIITDSSTNIEEMRRPFSPIYNNRKTNVIPLSQHPRNFAPEFRISSKFNLLQYIVRNLNNKDNIKQVR